ncbi:enoyl-CoA hydratase/isomerase family protein [Temperatibacter marinus]|uniref:3-hydroxyisobutyryl-CoA hydrolase n=1 Tax=Temperatibacter marinus TaxID=1456591 RepID=A0AA52EFC3_9PROT|nr:enoyl-CoA hydratase/isomerase family protein [Temperatibacter marinus]WND01504.1 enoyl-CoA hydratase/isomerase family protein [Temperatibacter marinus]
MTDEVLFSVRNGIGFITLNRPKALNSLTHVMAKSILDQLALWKSNTSVTAVVVTGTGDKAFCAGGDVVKIVQDYHAGGTGWREFFRDEYLMNIAINEFPKPYISFVDGITMGGGVGVSIPGEFWVASEKTMFAMPETGIGFFPDVGGGWFLPRLPGAVGNYLGLTGARLKQEDLYALGLATHVIPSEHVDAVIAALEKTEITGSADVQEILEGFHQSPDSAPIAAVMDDIDHVFDGFTVEDILAGLRELGTDWAQKQLSILESKSPLALKVTFEQLKRGAGLSSFSENMKMEYRMVVRWMAKGNFHEGVRALLIDKDNLPVWSPANLKDIEEEDVYSFFESFDARDDELF